MQNLDAKTIPLHGRHIIEASAGTGKTYNITEIYVRLLLEKRLLPSQILVMTFTKDATQEIIGRVEQKLREVLVEYIPERKVAEKNDYRHLKRALLEIDEAAIFTIHGFCKKILSEQAFASGMEMDISMEVDTSDILQKVVEDFFRKNINKNKEVFGLLKTNNLHTPEKFLAKNGLTNVIKSNYKILADEATSLENFNIQKQNQLSIFKNNQDIVDDFLSKLGRGEPEGKRVEEYHKILEWLTLKDGTIFPIDTSIITNGNKIKGTKVKPVFVGVKDLRDLYIENEQIKSAKFIQQVCIQIRQDFIKAKEQAGVMDFNDLISKLCQSVQASPELVKTLQKQYPVALIDEFQDTDAEQYQILDTIYPIKNSSRSHEDVNLFNSQQDLKDTHLREYDRELLLLMIGDPKQAIYGFRGGDIFTYLRAKNSTNNQWSMDTNWRSTREMIKAYNRLFYKNDYELEGEIGQDIFSKGIHYQTVKASEKAGEKKLDFDDELKPINYFYYQIEDTDNKLDIDKKFSSWTANEIVKLLNLGKVGEKDIAILVENRTQAKVVQDALSKKQLSSVYLSQRDNVYSSIEAKEILSLMEGLNELENKVLFKKALSTSLLGVTATEFIEFRDDESLEAWDLQIEKAKELRKKWHKLGFMALIMDVIHNSFKERNDSKERTITNILHLAELIKIAENKYKHPNQLIKWYRQQLKNTTNAEGELRLESDDKLIKVITIHGSKGLEYPVVFIPFASYVSTKKFQANKFNKYYDQKLGQTVYKIGKDNEVIDVVNKETIAELMRLFYVAVTRAEHRCYIGVAKYNGSEKSPLAQFLGYEKDNDWLDKILKITQNLDNQSLLINVVEQSNNILETKKADKNNLDLKANTIPKLENDNWEMLSFSRISKSGKVSYQGLDKEADEAVDEEASKSKLNLDFRFAAHKGADMGNILHNVLEHTDFTNGEVDNELLKQQVDRYKVVATQNIENLNQWLQECLEAPIEYQATISSNMQGELFASSNQEGINSFCLKDIPNSKTLKEAEFYFPVCNEKLYKSNILEILSEYRNKKLENIDKILNHRIFGMLHGFIDLIFEHNGKFYVADYKSNYLGDKLEDYNQSAMCEKNQSSMYDLQYLIYSVALVKYLKQNIPNYSFEEHFGGVYYFYLRGMKNGYGIYRAKPSKQIINKLSNLFAGDSDV